MALNFYLCYDSQKISLKVFKFCFLCNTNKAKSSSKILLRPKAEDSE